MASNPTKVVPINSSDDFAKHTTSLPSSALLILYFHAPWAAPCTQMSTVLDTLASTYEASDPPNISFLSVNAEEQPDISEEHDVTAVPYIVLKRDDKQLETISGSDAAKVREAVEKHAGSSSGKPAAQLPPAQQVTRGTQQQVPISTDAASNGDSTAAQPNGDSVDRDSSTGKAKNLSAYAPTSNDAATAPEYSSESAPGYSSKTENDPASQAGEEDLNTRLQQLTNAAPCMLFMKGTPSAPQCGFSRQLVSILRERGVRYGFFNILADDEVRQGLKTYADWPTFPQLWLSGELVGGLDIVREEMENDAGFFDEYSVDSSARNKGGPAAAEAQARPQVEA